LKKSSKMNAGNEWVVDAEGCSADSLQDLNTIRRLCDELIADLSLKVIGQPVWHKFPAAGGVTGLYLLSESHLACHTYPETGLATFNLYCCRPRPEWPWRERLTAELAAVRVSVRVVERGEQTTTEMTAAAIHEVNRG
jgi:S-adenosylmethionine decarboxylase